MKALVGAQSLISWFLRLGLLLYFYLLYNPLLFNTPQFSNAKYLIVIGAVFFAVLLFIGAFLKKESLSVISGFIILILSIIAIIKGMGIETWLWPGLIGLYFIAYGNRH